MEISSIDAHLLDLPLIEPFAASHGTTTKRTVVAIRVEAGGAVGWGECSALPAATYTAESAAGSFALLTDRVLPDLLVGNWSVLDDPDRLVELGRRHGPAPMALAGVEMALLDAELSAAGTPLASWLGVDRAEVPAGVSLGLAEPARVVERAAALAAEGYRRLKVKIQPGHDREVLGLLMAHPAIGGADVEVQLDANGAYGPGDLDLMVELVDGGAAALEQPLAPADAAASAELVRRLRHRAEASDRPSPVPVVADEAVATIAEAEDLADRGAMTAVSIKPARVGGMITARTLHDRCRDRGLSATAGGMLETGLGRHALAALAALPGFDLTGDLSPAGRWLAADPWPDLAMVDGTIRVPDGPGVAPEPDGDLLARYTVEQRRWS